MPQKTPLKTLTLGQLTELNTADEQDLASQIVLDQKNATCTFKVASPYEVDLDTIRTEADLFAWVLCLNQETWMTSQHLAFFIRIVARYKGFSLRLPGPQPAHSQN